MTAVFTLDLWGHILDALKLHLEVFIMK